MKFSPRLGAPSFLLLFSLANAAVFQWPLYRFALSTRSGWNVDTALALSTLFVLQLLVSLAVLGLAAACSARVMQALCAFLVFGNAIALYFIVQYRIVIDATLIGNIANTNAREAGEFAHPMLLLYVVMLGLLPAWLLLRVRIRQTGRGRTLALVGLALLLGSAWLYANARSWLWIDRHAKQFGGLILPWSYVINTVRYAAAVSERHRVVQLLPPLSAQRPGGAVLVLVIGEAARAQNFSLLGYSRETNPLLKGDDVVAYPGAHACATYTTAALRCMLSYRGAAGATGNDEPLPSYLFRQGIEVIWRSNNFGEPALKVSRYASAAQLRAACQHDCVHLDYDEVLLRGLADEVQAGAATAKTLIILHQGGSHGPLYASKVPPELVRFSPSCHSVELQQCSATELVNAYDNTIVYTDYFLHRLIGILRSASKRPAAMLYMADHGESLGEGGLYLHGMPLSLAPEVQRAVPLLVWMSDAFRRSGVTARPAAEFPGGPTQDVVFHSVMGALGLRSPVYAPAQDLFRTIAPAGSVEQGGTPLAP